MMNREDSIKRIMLWSLMFVLFIPWIQDSFDIFKERKLHGAILKKENPILDEKGWWQGNFQKTKEEYLNDEFGFRPFFVRFNNQLELSCFGKVHANYIIKGKEDYWFEYNYVKSYYGLDYVGEDSITNHVLRIKKVQDLLAKQNKTFLFVMTASKGQYYPEYFPDSCKYKKNITNYEVYIDKIKKAGVNYIDFNDYFLKLKKETVYPLYSKYGIHWTTYGACLAADSIIHYLEQKRNIDCPELYWDSLKSEPAHDYDRDIELGLNLFFPFEQQELVYPVLKYEDGEGKQKPSVMVVADSYYWSLLDIQIFNSFSKNEFWYYYSLIFLPGVEGTIRANDTLLRTALVDFDVFILLATDANLYNLGWEFIERSKNILESNNDPDLEFNRKVENLKAYIPTDSTWIKDIRIKAAKKGITVDSMVTLDAIYIAKQEMGR